MKLLITTLTMIFISFASNATLPIKEMFAHCKPLQNNGFKIQNLDNIQQINALTCMSYMRALRDVGEWNCFLLNTAKRRGTDTKSKGFQIAKTLMANANADVTAVVASFNKFAENNPDKWDKPIGPFSNVFLSAIFPCKIKE